MEDHQNDTISDLQDIEELISDDELSLCDLPIYDHEEEESHLDGPKNSSPELDLFEFAFNSDHETGSTSIPKPMVFCGKPIPETPKTRDFYRQTTNGLFLRRDYSFKRSRSLRSESVKSPSVDAKPLPAAEGKRRHRPISGEHRKQKVLIGLVKFQPEMEMSEIRKRQSRRSPAKMFPATEGNVEGVTQWGLLKPFRCRTHFLSALTKASFRCMQHV